jgi:hypothetical protein
MRDLFGVIKMFIIPRTPSKPARLSPINSPTTVSSNEKDVYDKFLDIYFRSDLSTQKLILKTVTDFVGHPAYTHILNTMDKGNAYYVIGYLRSQRSIDMYFILDQIIHNNMVASYDFSKTHLVR